MKVPEELSYTKEHEWVRATDNEATIGITDFAQSQLGDIIFLELPEIGDKVVAGESFGEIEAVKTVSELYSPVNGVVTSVNEVPAGSADNTDPPLNPNHPNHSNAEPRIMNLIEDGFLSSCKLTRLPTSKAKTRPETPALM